ncbi:MAG: hypothetical protein M5U32_18475 [Myxococcota bacterium]|nr:hypothetical protein [Myxococcota bacterium]
MVNGDDEGEFEADLSPSQGKLDLAVDFYKRGKFPPGAYHSEGHQDGMGVCLYLALMKRVLGESFRLAVLDDVVMSIDRDHRKAFCKLLKDKFPETQFVITTHERTWAEQMTTTGLVPSKSSVAFRGWKIETGPLVHAVEGIWEDIAGDLAKDKVSGAAGTLRRHMEYVLREIAHELSAAVPYRSGDECDVGDLFPAVLRRYRDLLGKAAAAAQDWSNNAAKEAVKARKDALSEKTDAYGGENWMINKSIHFNDWIDLTSAEFEPVVAAFRGILDELRCAKCDAWLQVAPKRLDTDTLTCDCGEVSLKLKGK